MKYALKRLGDLKRHKGQQGSGGKRIGRLRIQEMVGERERESGRERV